MLRCLFSYGMLDANEELNQGWAKLFIFDKIELKQINFYLVYVILKGTQST